MEELSVLKTQFKEHCKSFENLKDDVKEVKVELKSKVNWKTFTWVLGILMTIILGVLGLIYTEVQDVDDKVNNTDKSISNIEGYLMRVEIKYE